MATVSMDESLGASARKPESPSIENSEGGGTSLPRERTNREDLRSEFFSNSPKKFMEYADFFGTAAWAVTTPCAWRVAGPERHEKNEEASSREPRKQARTRNSPPPSPPAAGRRASAARMEHQRSKRALMECTQ